MELFHGRYMLIQIITVVDRNREDAVTRLSWGEETAGKRIIRTSGPVQTFLHLWNLHVCTGMSKCEGGPERSQDEPSSSLAGCLGASELRDKGLMFSSVFPLVSTPEPALVRPCEWGTGHMGLGKLPDDDFTLVHTSCEESKDGGWYWFNYQQKESSKPASRFFHLSPERTFLTALVHLWSTPVLSKAESGPLCLKCSERNVNRDHWFFLWEKVAVCVNR